MDTFYVIVSVIAVIILIIIFSSIGVMLKYSSTNNIYPPTANTCPEYWNIDSSNNCIIPTSDSNNPNKGTLYRDNGIIYLTTDSTDTSGKIYTPGYDSNSGTINFSDVNWSSEGKTAVCYKKEWASKNSIEWDGISNYNACT